MLVDYHFKQLEKNDTVEILYNSPPRFIQREPQWD